MMHEGLDKCARCEALSRQLAALQAENQKLREHSSHMPVENSEDAAEPVEEKATNREEQVDHDDSRLYSPLSRAEMERYSRQMLVPDFRICRQVKLRQARVLIIGAGGLGCPAALYLGGMGVGCIGIVDDDRVERSNLHRQIGHQESMIGQLKVESLAERVRLLNPDVQIEIHATRFSSKNATKLVRAYDVALDASDNPATRYLVNDACSMEKKPLVSGSALGLEGQVTVFTFAADSPCYRCLYPTPPRQPQSCVENGVLGVVPGIIGCLQALETVRVLTELGTCTSGTQLLFDAYDGQFRRLKMSTKRRTGCPSCEASEVCSLIDTELCLSADAHSSELNSEHRLEVATFAQLRRSALTALSRYSKYILLDTRVAHQFEMVHFPEAVNVPFDQLLVARKNGRLVEFVRARLPPNETLEGDVDTLVICRRGVDSAVVTSWLLECGLANVRNVDGGYTLYADESLGVDAQFPMY